MVPPQGTSHRIIEEFGLKGIFKAHLVQHPCNEQGHLQPKQIAQTPVQPNLEGFKRWASASSLGNLFQLFPAFSGSQLREFQNQKWWCFTKQDLMDFSSMKCPCWLSPCKMFSIHDISNNVCSQNIQESRLWVLWVLALGFHTRHIWDKFP